MALDVRTAQTELENAIRDAILYALGARLPAVESVAALRAVPTQGASSSMRTNDDLIAVVVGGVVSASYRWVSTSTAADDGDTWVKPDDVAANGRWHRWTSPLRIAFDVGGNSQYLHEIQSGPLSRVLVFDKGMSDDVMLSLVSGKMPAVVIEAAGDDPVDATENTGHRWFTEFHFDVYVLNEQLRDRREAAQGSAVPGETKPGANTIDGWIQALLGGTQMHAVIDGIRNVRVGHGANATSDLGQRRVVRARSYSFLATVEHPNAPNDTGAAEQVNTQQNMADLGAEEGESIWDVDLDNYLVDGIDVTEGVGLTKAVRAGSAVIAGDPVAYPGQLYTFVADRDTYRDLMPDGTMTFVVVDTDEAEPAVTATALRIGVTRTDGSGVVSDRITAERYAPYGNPIQTPLA